MYCFLRKTYKSRELCGIKLQRVLNVQFDNQKDIECYSVQAWDYQLILRDRLW